MKILPEEHQERLKLYRKGLSDAQIAEKVYVVRSTIFKWRKKHGLPPNNNDGVRRDKKGSCLSEHKNKLRMKLYKRGFQDREIAYVFGLTKKAICAWRRLRHLPPNEGLPVITEYDMRHYAPDVEEFWEKVREGGRR